MISHVRDDTTEGLQTSIYNAVTRRSQENWPWLLFTSPQSTMAEQKKQERDFTPEVDSIIPVTTSLAQVDFIYLITPEMLICIFPKSGELQDALDRLFALEKQTRNVS
jgi:hypothetical protein